MTFCGEAMVASKGNLQCEVCHLDGFSNKSSLKRHQRFFCKGATVCTDVKQPQQPLTTDVKVVAVSKEEVIVNTAEVPEVPDIPVLRLLSRSDSEQFKMDHRGNTLAQVG